MQNNSFEQKLSDAMRCQDSPTQQLNQQLFAKLQGTPSSVQKSTYSIWWLPAVATTLFSLISMMWALLFLPTTFGRFSIFLLGSHSITFSWLLTLIGVKKFNLKTATALSICKNS